MKKMRVKIHNINNDVIATSEAGFVKKTHIYRYSNDIDYNAWVYRWNGTGFDTKFGVYIVTGLFDDVPLNQWVTTDSDIKNDAPPIWVNSGTFEVCNEPSHDHISTN